MMQQVFKSFPNDNPITGICVVEDPGKCPTDFTVVLRTHDQDSDADLWREVSFFGRKTRYLCISKAEGIFDHVINNIMVISEKENPPEGFANIPRTLDADSRAWRKKQLCYSFALRTMTSTAVSDIVLLAKTKSPPSGFSVAGEINGIVVCFKSTKLTEISNGAASIFDIPKPIANRGSTNGYPNLSHAASPNNGDYVNLVPVRPAPLPPSGLKPHFPPPTSPVPAPSTATYGTLSGHLGLEGVPFILNSKFLGISSKQSNALPVIKARTADELDEEASRARFFIHLQYTSSQPDSITFTKYLPTRAPALSNQTNISSYTSQPPSLPNQTTVSSNTCQPDPHLFRNLQTKPTSHLTPPNQTTRSSQPKDHLIQQLPTRSPSLLKPPNQTNISSNPFQSDHGLFSTKPPSHPTPQKESPPPSNTVNHLKTFE